MSITEPEIKLSYMELQGVETALKKFIRFSANVLSRLSFSILLIKKLQSTALSKADYLLEDCPSLLVTGWAFHYPHILLPTLWCQENHPLSVRGIIMIFQFKTHILKTLTKACWLLNEPPKNCRSVFHSGIPLPHDVDLVHLDI